MAKTRVKELVSLVRCSKDLSLAEFTKALICATEPKNKRIEESELLNAWVNARAEAPEIGHLIEASLYWVSSEVEVSEKKQRKLQEKAIATWTILASDQIERLQR